MKVKDLKDIIKNLDDDMDVIISGEYNLADNAAGAHVRKMVYSDTESASEEKEYLVIDLNSYIFEWEDTEDMCMYMSKSDADELYS
jgi:hypothetical protein